MGLIKAALGSFNSTMADQWREFFYCDSLDADTLAVKGRKRVTKRSSNTKGEENIISNGSVIAVNEGQFMMIVDNGKVIDFTAEPGEYTYDMSTEPSMLYGGFGKGLLASFKNMGQRFTFGGQPGKDQRVYFVNTKEIVGNKYGTPAPVPFRVVDQNIGLDIDVSIRCFGEYSYRITDPIIFYTNLCGNIVDSYNRSSIDSQLKSELMTALQPAFAKISALGIRYSALPGHTQEIADALNSVLSDKWKGMRGIEVASFAVSSVTASEEDEEMIKNLQKQSVYRNPNMAAAALTNAQAEAMVNASQNENGAMMGFMGMGMAQAAGGINATNLYQMGASQQQNQNFSQAQQPHAAGAATAENTWTCEKCGHSGNPGKFCTECGSPRPEKGWVCPKCGKINLGKFCSECGEKKPAGEKLYKCDKCGWEPEDPANPPKFCPECGDRFDDNDIK